jgi:APA family basic amino acid/polyamine antiporter
LSNGKLPEKNTGRGHLLSVLGVGFGLAVIIGNTIAAGILRAPGEIAAQLPSPWIFLGVWLLGGGYALLGAISIAELGTIVPRSGGQYVFSRKALGEYAGFVVGWSDWLSTCGSTAAVAIVVGEFTTVLIPQAAGYGQSIALAVTLIFAGLQWHGIVWGSWAQNVTSLLKTIAFAVLIAACFVLGGGGAADAKPTELAVGWPLMAAIVVALQSVIYTYDGWAGVVYFSEEVHEPVRNIPRALFGGVLAVTAIYLLVNAALLYVLPISRIEDQKFAAGAAAVVIFGPKGDTIFRIITIVSLLSGINAYHLMSSRVLFAMSRDGLVARSITRVNDGGTPTLALLLSTVVAVLFIVLAQTFAHVVAVLAFFFIANYTLSFISLFVLRRKQKGPSPGYRAWGFPFTTGLSLLGSVVFLVGAVVADKTNDSRYALLLLVATVPIFLFQRAFKRRSRDLA